MTRLKETAVRSLRLAVILGTAALLVICPGQNLGPYRVITIYSEDGSREVFTNKFVVEDILAEAEIVLDAKLERTEPGLDQEPTDDCIVIDRAVPLKIRVDGLELEVITWAGTIGGVLAEQNISYSADDLISLPLAEAVNPGLEVDIIRVARELVYEEKIIAAKTDYKNDSSLSRGKKRVAAEAQDGKKLITYEVIYHDGVEVARAAVGEKILVQPVAGLVYKGTKPTGPVLEGLASYYGAELHGSRTASGEPFDMNALTAAHKTLPFGTRVRVTYLKTGKSVVVRINDRGPFVSGRIIDLSAAAAKAIGMYSAGVGRVRLEILD